MTEGVKKSIADHYSSKLESVTSTKQFRGAKNKTTSILVRKSKIQPAFIVLDDEGIDRTPKSLDPYVYEGAKERQVTSITVADDASESTVILQTSNRVKSETNLKSIAPQAMDDTFVSVADEAFIFEDVTTPALMQQEIEPVVVKAPTHISIILNETNTIYVLDIPSSTEIRDTPEGDKVAEDNDNYEYLTVGKGRNRRTISVGIQTLPILMKTRDTDCVHIMLHDTGAYASNWEMYDTYETTVEQTEDEEDDDDVLVLPGDEQSLDSYRMAHDEKEILKTVRSPKFQEALCIIERLLANNTFNEQQKIFRDISDKEQFTDDEVKYKYTLEHLWSFSNDDCKSKAITSMEWNPANKDLLAVSYGKFFVTDWLEGTVNIWNIKNPVQPERHYTFTAPITDISFSILNPNILAVGLYTGKIYLINIARRDLHIVAESAALDKESMEIVHQIEFMPPKSVVNMDNEDEFLAIYENGKVLLFRTTSTRFLKYQQIMRTPKSDGKLKGLETIRRCTGLKVPVSRYAAALVLCQNPTDPTIYYIGANDGVIHTCSRNYLNQHLDQYLAHEGPVNAISFHPFCDKIIITCGSDMYTRFWAEGIPEPIAQYCHSLTSPVDCIFSPTHPTICVAIRSNSIYFWDIQRKAMKPQSTTVVPTGAYCSTVSFKDNGKCLLVGDTAGHVHIYSLQDIPYPPFFPENLLVSTLRQQLLYKPLALEKILLGVKRTSILNKMREIKKPKTVPTDTEGRSFVCKDMELGEDNA